MVSTPDSMEALKVMTDYLEMVEKKSKTDPTNYLRDAAICSGLMAIVYELRKLRIEMEKR